jgi:putative chitinase
MITIPQIRSGAQWITQERADKYGQSLIDAMTVYRINTPARIAAFLAQVVHESGELKTASENLNYSAGGLRKTFPKYFTNDDIAKQYEHQPDKIANYVYANRMGNGNEASGDGAKYKGRGLIQLTGRDNYAKLTIDMNVDFITDPELLEHPHHAAMSAAWFWNKHELNDLADLNTMASFTSITKVINGGTNGLESRIGYWVAYKHTLGI